MSARRSPVGFVRRIDVHHQPADVERESGRDRVQQAVAPLAGGRGNAQGVRFLPQQPLALDRRPGGRTCCTRREPAPWRRPRPRACGGRRPSPVSRPGAAASMTCSSRSAAATSSSVARNAATSVVRQAIDEADGVRDEQFAAVGQPDAAHQRVERDEQGVGGDGRLAGQEVEQRRLAGVGVADQRDGRDRRPCAAARATAAAAGAPLRFRRPRPRCAGGCAGGPPRAWFRRGPACRCRRPAATATRCRRRAAAAGSCNCASSTCSLPSRVRARVREDVEDQLRAVDHLALGSRFSICRSCAGVSSLSKITRSRRSRRRRRPAPRACRCRGTWPHPGARAPAAREGTTLAPAASARPASSSSDRSASTRRIGPVIRPTSAARSAPSCGCVKGSSMRHGSRGPSRNGTAPARTRTGGSARASTIVEGGPPAVGPPSSQVHAAGQSAARLPLARRRRCRSARSVRAGGGNRAARQPRPGRRQSRWLAPGSPRPASRHERRASPGPRPRAPASAGRARSGRQRRASGVKAPEHRRVLDARRDQRQRLSLAARPLTAKTRSTAAGRAGPPRARRGCRSGR